jgi:hypothetical protein
MLAIPGSHRTAPYSILSWKSLRKMVGNVICENEVACTVWKIANLYMKNINAIYLILTPAQREILCQDFTRTDNISNTIPELQYSGPVEFKREHTDSDPPPLSIDRALVLLILALGQTFDDDSLTEREGSPSDFAVFKMAISRSKM